MKKIEAIKMMLDGKKVRRNNWPPTQYIYFGKDSNIFKFKKENENELMIDMNNFEYIDDWEIYQEPKKKIKKTY